MNGPGLHHVGMKGHTDRVLQGGVSGKELLYSRKDLSQVFCLTGSTGWVMLSYSFTEKRNQNIEVDEQKKTEVQSSKILSESQL